MKKTLKIGLSASMAFAFMFATSLSVVAQENIATPTDKSGVEFVAANMFANTLQKLNSQLSATKASINAPVKMIEEAPTTKVVHQAERPLRATKWFQYNGPAPDEPGVDYDAEIRDPSNYSPVNPNDPMEEPDCEGDEQVCGVETEEGSTTGQPDQEALDDLIDDYDNNVNLNHIIEKDIEQS